MQAVADVRHVRVEELELRRVREPAGDQGRRVALPASLPEAGRDQRRQLGLGREATRQRSGVPLRDRRHEPRSHAHRRNAMPVAAGRQARNYTGRRWGPRFP